MSVTMPSVLSQSLTHTHTQTCIHTRFDQQPLQLFIPISRIINQHALCYFVSFRFLISSFWFFSWITVRSNVQLLKSRQLRYLTDFLLGSTPDRGWHNFWYNLVVGAQCVCNRDHFESQHTVPTCKCNGNKGGVGKLLWWGRQPQKWLLFNYFVPMWQKSIAKTVGVRG